MNDRLSPRRLIYSKDHIRWLCEIIELTNGGDTETRKWPSSTRRDQKERFPHHLSPRITTSTINGGAILQSYDAWNSWLSIVREYNLRSLTKSKDKLCAISKIAELYHLKTGDQYCVGPWRSHLAEKLLWDVFPSARRVLVNDSRVPRPCQYLPSPYYTSTETKLPRTNMVMGFRRRNNRQPHRAVAFVVRGGNI